MRRILFTLLFVILLFISLMSMVGAETVDLYSGRAHYYELDTMFDSLNWVGLKVINDATPLADSNFPFVALSLTVPVTLEVTFPGYNLNDGDHYYAAMFGSTFNQNNLLNVSVTDLEADELFDSTYYPQFYQNSYYAYSDNPQETFCCSTTNVEIGGINYTAFVVTINQNINYYLLKYNDDGDIIPLFITPFEDAICYNSTACVGEFMLPKSPEDYNFFVLNQNIPYDYNIYIDGVSSNTFAQTALPYNLTVEVYYLYTGDPASNVSVLVGEDAGQNLFIPYKLSGYLGSAYAVGKTDDAGYESFLVAPTVYPTDSDYAIYVAVLQGGDASSITPLYVTSKDALIPQDKTFSSNRLTDNARASVNAMNQIASFMYQWSSQLVQAKKFGVTYNLGADSFTTYDYQQSQIIPNSIEMKTGAPNVFSTNMINYGLNNPSEYRIRIKESDGYLIMNPYTDDTPLTETDRMIFEAVPVGQDFIVTPTSLGFISSTITFEVLGPSGDVVNSMTMNVSSELNIVTGGSFYNNDDLKTTVNAMNQILNSLYNSLN